MPGSVGHHRRRGSLRRRQVLDLVAGKRLGRQVRGVGPLRGLRIGTQALEALAGLELEAGHMRRA